MTTNEVPATPADNAAAAQAAIEYADSLRASSGITTPEDGLAHAAVVAQLAQAAATLAVAQAVQELNAQLRDGIATW